ncbi:MAG TPA: hypothetical protein VFI74_04190 [Candidatus Saccharimonadales bacterium]|nr:hypothetical protein [Candidatus Saccharimonadales bacterium]
MDSPEAQSGLPSPKPLDRIGQAAFSGARQRILEMRIQLLDEQQAQLQRQLSILAGIALGNGISPYGKYFPAESSSKMTLRQVPPTETDHTYMPPQALIEKQLEHKDKGIRFPLTAVVIPVITPNHYRRAKPARTQSTTYLSIRPNPAVVALGEPVPPRYKPKGDGSYAVRFN